MVHRTNPSLWARVVEEGKRNNGGKWSARLAQQCVQRYKALGGGYTDTGSQKATSLNKWSREQWQYAGKEGKSRYLPKKVIESAPSELLIIENRRKGSRKGENVRYSPSLTALMRKKRIFVYDFQLLLNAKASSCPT